MCFEKLLKSCPGELVPAQSDSLRKVDIFSFHVFYLFFDTSSCADMTVANHYILFDFFEKLNIEMVTDYFIVTSHRGQRSFDSFPGELVSLFPQRFGTVVSTTALKYPLNETVLNPSARGISNQSIGATFSVVASDPILVFRGHPKN